MIGQGLLVCVVLCLWCLVVLVAEAVETGRQEKETIPSGAISE